MKSFTPMAVIGAGSWGSALAIELANNGTSVKIWGNEPDVLQVMAKERCNERYLPQISLPDKLQIAFSLGEVLSNIHDILLAIPSHAFRETVIELKPFLTSQHRIAWATKGLDSQDDLLLIDVITEILGSDLAYATMSGPTFATEVARGLPSAITIASNNKQFSKDLSQRLRNDAFRIYYTDDMRGIGLCGAVKNVLAIAVGLSDGLNFGANTRAALITRGLVEMMDLGLAMNAKRETFMGLAGLGDLVLTCTDDQSRNRRFGKALGQGKSIQEIKKEIGQVVEGAQNAKQVHRLALKYQVAMPICSAVYEILEENASPSTVIKQIFSEAPSCEF